MLMIFFNLSCKKEGPHFFIWFFFLLLEEQIFQYSQKDCERVR